MSPLPLQIFYQPDDLARFGVPPGLEFGIYQRIVHLDLEPASGRWNECQALDLRLELREQVFCQDNCPVSVVSDGAVGD